MYCIHISVSEARQAIKIVSLIFVLLFVHYSEIVLQSKVAGFGFCCWILCEFRYKFWLYMKFIVENLLYGFNPSFDLTPLKTTMVSKARYLKSLINLLLSICVFVMLQIRMDLNEYRSRWHLETFLQSPRASSAYNNSCKLGAIKSDFWISRGKRRKSWDTQRNKLPVNYVSTYDTAKLTIYDFEPIISTTHGPNKVWSSAKVIALYLGCSISFVGLNASLNS